MSEGCNWRRPPLLRCHCEKLHCHSEHSFWGKRWTGVTPWYPASFAGRLYAVQGPSADVQMSGNKCLFFVKSEMKKVAGFITTTSIAGVCKFSGFHPVYRSGESSWNTQPDRNETLGQSCALILILVEKKKNPSSIQMKHCCFNLDIKHVKFDTIQWRSYHNTHKI